jgi:hypothetical protein
MIKELTTNHFAKMSFTLVLVFLVSVSTMLFFLGHLETQVNASVEIKTAEKNSTVSKAKSNSLGDEVGMTFVITDAPSNSTSTIAVPNTSSDPSSIKNESNFFQNTDTSKTSSQTDNQSSKPVYKDTNNTPSKTIQSNNMQRGEYKVDANGIHYYNINNCSEVKGSSGIGDLSECEDAEREMLRERYTTHRLFFSVFF